MPDASSILAQFGILIPELMIEAAQAENVDLAVAATVLMGESGGGANIWGHDTTNTGGYYVPGGPVTWQNYRAYRGAMLAGHIPRNGVGPAQCTSSQYQDTADALGGCWNPLANMRSGFRGLGALIRAYGVQVGAQHYNGAGPQAVEYGRVFFAHYQVWKSRLAGATSEGDDLTPEQAQQLADIHDRVCRLETAWGGGVTDANNTPYDMRLLVNRVDVEVHQARADIARLTALVQQGAKS